MWLDNNGFKIYLYYYIITFILMYYNQINIGITITAALIKDYKIGNIINII